VLVATIATGALGAQENINKRIKIAHPEEDKPFEFPQWAKDIRRADIVAFGAFPLVWMWSSFVLVIKHGNDWSYYAGPFSQSSGDKWENEDYKLALGCTAGICIGAALADFVIVSVKRYMQDKAKRLAKTPPTITRQMGVPLSQIESVPPGVAGGRATQ
jgi:hypothetical protein